MNDDELRAALAQADPTHRVPPDGPAASPTAHEIRERIMETIDRDDMATRTEPASRWRRPALVAAAAASVAGLALGAAVLGGGNDAPAKKRPPTTLALSLPDTGGAVTSSSCVMFDVQMLAQMPMALAGTATAVSSTGVTLDVDRWYKGGDADVVTIATPPGNTSAALDGVEFTQGSRYLVTATDGTVNGCGFSGPATAELERSFAEAFPS